MGSRRITSKRRAGRAVRRRNRRDAWALIRANALKVLIGAAIVLGGFAVGTLVARTPFQKGFFLGAGVATSIAMVGYFLAIHGFVALDMGAEAERWSTAKLRKLGKRWRVLDDISF